MTGALPLASGPIDDVRPRPHLRAFGEAPPPLLAFLVVVADFAAEAPPVQALIACLDLLQPPP